MLNKIPILLLVFLSFNLSNQVFASERMHSDSDIAQFLAAARADLAANSAGVGTLSKVREFSPGYIIFLFKMKDGTYCRSYITSIEEPVTGFVSLHLAPHSLGLVCGIRGRD